jgi:flagellin-like hook-associated protein FlgL
VHFRKIFLAIVIAFCFIGRGTVPIVHADVSSHFDIWWIAALWDNRYVGNTVVLDFYVYNTEPSVTDTISSLQVVTPWQNFSDSSLPVSLCQGCRYNFTADISIPTTQQPDEVYFTVYFTGTFGDGGGAFCYDEGSVCSDVISVNISPDPYTLQNQVSELLANETSLSANITALQSQVSALNGQLAAADENISSLKAADANMTAMQAQIQADRMQISTLQGTIATLQNENQSNTELIARLQQNLTSIQSGLQTSQVELGDAQANLSAKQASLLTVSDYYLPVGIIVPAAIAATLLVLYVRKRNV